MAEFVSVFLFVFFFCVYNILPILDEKYTV